MATGQCRRQLLANAAVIYPGVVRNVHSFSSSSLNCPMTVAFYPQVVTPQLPARVDAVRRVLINRDW